MKHFHVLIHNIREFHGTSAFFIFRASSKPVVSFASSIVYELEPNVEFPIPRFNYNYCVKKIHHDNFYTIVFLP